jgi:hypothetical protein
MDGFPVETLNRVHRTGSEPFSAPNRGDYPKVHKDP